jgi:predicted DNA-binding transcriptional regulator AlpA
MRDTRSRSSHSTAVELEDLRKRGEELGAKDRAETPHEDGSTTYLPARRVQDRYGICDRTLDRWIKDESVGFPKPIVVHRRRYWRVGELVAFERRRAAKVS